MHLLPLSRCLGDGEKGQRWPWKGLRKGTGRRGGWCSTVWHWVMTHGMTVTQHPHFRCTPKAVEAETPELFMQQSHSSVTYGGQKVRQHKCPWMHAQRNIRTGPKASCTHGRDLGSHWTMAETVA